MYSIKFEYTLKVRTFIEILAQNGSFKMGALLGNFSLTGSQILGSYAWVLLYLEQRQTSFAVNSQSKQWYHSCTPLAV